MNLSEIYCEKISTTYLANKRLKEGFYATSVYLSEKQCYQYPFCIKLLSMTS